MVRATDDSPDACLSATHPSRRMARGSGLPSVGRRAILPAMQAYTTIQNLRDRTGETVEFRGWLCGKRTAGQLIFALVRDGTGICQCVIEARTAGAFAAAGKAPLECSVVVHGVPRADERAPGGIELSVSDFTVLQGAEGYPIARKEHGVDFLMNRRHLWLRSQRQTAILRVRHTLIAAARRFFDERGFTLVDTPIFQPSAAEGAGSLFPVEYFGERVFLAQTGQLYLEAAAMALGRVYCFGPTFRAEKSKTRRHLTEFWMVEPEMAFFELTDNMDLAERFLKRLCGDVLQQCAEDVQFFNEHIDTTVMATIEKIVSSRFVRLPYTEAVALLEKSGHPFEFPIAWGADLQSEHERYLTEQHFQGPVIVYDYPRTIKPFYMRVNDDGRTVRAMDVLAPKVGEIIGGSQREERLDVLRQRMAEQGLNPNDYWWYLDLRRFGTVPHAGFGLGLERVLQFVTGMANIRDVIPFPRTPGNAEF